MPAIDPPDAHLFSLVIAIAESSTLDELGAACHRAVKELIHAPVLGLYLIRDSKPYLLYSHNAPRGFLDEYRIKLASHDPMIEMLMRHRRSVAGSILRSSRSWNVRLMEDLLHRWGFQANMCGPVFIDSCLAGLIYTADIDEAEPDPVREERLDFICRAAAIALRRITSDYGLQVTFDVCDCSDINTATLSELPPRLSQVAELVCRGQTNKEIARTLAISHHTVKEHVAALCRRFQAQNRTELATAMLKMAQVGRSVRNTSPLDMEGLTVAPSPKFQLSEACPDYF
ncbi:LuxR C-terminal-related transcriptional regulator [Pseudochelatococcus sp. B33]